MNLVLVTHPDFLGSQSQPRFARMLAEGFAARGHQVDLRRPQARVRRLAPGRAAKWAGYVDQYLLFPRELASRAAADPPDTLYVFCDQALGPWVPTLAHRPHVVHCHDLLALRSALGLVPENRTAYTGRIYQRYIRAGFARARHFISISEKSRDDLHRYGRVRPASSDVVYNGLNHPYRRQPRGQALATLRAAGLPDPGADGLLLHVGGGQWYKNAHGVVAIYARHAANRARAGRTAPPLWMVSPPPSPSLGLALAAVPPEGQVRFIPGVSTQVVEALYSLADALLFPSLAEGFGWPIAEAMACGCPVLTTGDAPMNEVGGEHAHYLPRLRGPADLADWAAQGARVLAMLDGRHATQREADARAGIGWARRFDQERAIDAYRGIYERILGHR